MQVRILREAGESDTADRLSEVDLVSRLDQHTAGGEVAVLGFPLLRMFDDDAIATFGLAHRFASRFCESAVRRVIACTKNAAACRRAHVHAGLLHCQ